MTKKIKKEKFKPPVLTKAEVVTQEEMIKRYPLGGFDEGDPRIFFIGPTYVSIFSLPIELLYEFRLNGKLLQVHKVIPIDSIVADREYDRGYGMDKLENYAAEFKISGFDCSWEWQATKFKVLTLFT